MRSLQLSVVLCLTILSLQSAGAGEKTLASYFPRNTLLYAEGKFSREMTDLCSSTALGKIWNEPQVQDFLKQPLSRLDELTAILNSISDLKMADLTACLSPNVGVGFILDREDPSLLLVLTPPDAATGKRVVDNLPSFLQKSGLGGKLHTTDGAIRVCQLGPGWVSCVVRDGRLLLAIDDTRGPVSGKGQTLKKILAVPAGERLPSSTSFAATTAALGGSQLVKAFVNLEFAMQLADAERKVAAMLSALGLKNTRGLGMSIGVNPPGFTTQSLVRTDDTTKGLFSLLKNKPVSDELQNALPAAVNFASASRLDLGNLMKLIRQVTAQVGMPAGEIDQNMAMVQQQFGFNPEADLLNQLGDEAACVLIKPEEVGGLPLLGLNGLTFVVRIKNREKVEKTLTSICSLGAMLADSSSLGGSMLKDVYGTQKITGVKVASGVVAPCFAVTNSFLVISTGPQGVKKVLATIEGKEPRLTALAAFKDVMQRLGGTRGVGFSYMAQPAFSMLGGDIGSMSILSGLLVPALSRARGAARKVRCISNLKQMGLGIEMYTGETYYGKMPSHMKDLYEDGDGVVPDKEAHVCPQSGKGYHYIQGLKIDSPANTIVAFDAKESHAGGRNVLFRDSHVKFLKEEQFQKELARSLESLKKAGVAVKVLAPWMPPGIRPRPAASPLTPVFKTLAQAQRRPEILIRSFLETFQFYRMPPAKVINRHMVPSGSVTAMTGDSIMVKGYGPFPFGNSTGNADASALMGGNSVAVTAIIAAIAIPNLLESRMQANETNACASLRMYATAQNIFKKANYAASNGLKPRQYAPDFRMLGGRNACKKGDGTPIQLVPDVFADATRNMPYNGYYFINSLNVKNWEWEFGLYAVPVVYEKTGVNTFHINAQGIVRMKDLGGQTPTKDTKVDQTWVLP